MNEEMSLLEFIDESPSPYHAVENIIKILEKEDYHKFSKTLDIDFVEIKRDINDISATKVRNSLISDDIKSFKNNMGIFDKNLYNEMKLQIMMPTKESIENPKYIENKSVNNVLEITLTEYIGGIWWSDFPNI